MPRPVRTRPLPTVTGARPTRKGSGGSKHNSPRIGFHTGRCRHLDPERSVPIGVCTSTSGCLCTKTPLPCARLRMSLAALRLHHGRRSGDADLELAAVDGCDPPFGMPGTASGKVACARPCHPPRRGRSRPSDPSRKGVQRRCGAADRQFYRPSSRCVCATAEDRARTRGERQTVGCRERRAMSRRFGSPETLGCGKAPIRESPARSLPRP